MEIEEQEGNSFVHFRVKKEISKNKQHGSKANKNNSKKKELSIESQIKENYSQNSQKSIDLQKSPQLVPKMSTESQDKEENKPKENIRIVDMDIIPIVRHLKMQTVYMLAGDVMVDLDFGMKEDEHPICQISAINSFKNPIRVQVLSEYMSNEVDMTNSQDSLKEFSKIIEILMNYPDKYAHDFGKVLNQYQIFVNGQLQKAEFLKANMDFKSLIPTFDREFEEFLVDARAYLKKTLVTNKFQFYMIVKSNMTSFTHDISRFGLSEGLCELLGGNGDSIATLILRRGLFEFFSKETRNNFYFYYLSQLLNVKDVSIEKSISLVTLDGIELKVNYEMETYFGKNPEPNVIFFYPYMLIMITFDVKPYMVKQVMNIRATLDNETQQYMREFEEDIYYSLESQIFLESYYSDYYKKVVQNNGQGLPREKRKYKKHPQTKHQLDFRQQNQTVISNVKQEKQNKQKLPSTSANSCSDEHSPSNVNGNCDNVIDDLNLNQQVNIQNQNSEYDEQSEIKSNQNTIGKQEYEEMMNNQESQGEKNSSYDSYLQYKYNNNHQNQYPYVSQNYNNYENLNVQNFNQQTTNIDNANPVPKHQQKIKVEENISIYQASQYANHQQKLDASQSERKNNELNSPYSSYSQNQQLEHQIQNYNINSSYTPEDELMLQQKEIPVEQNNNPQLQNSSLQSNYHNLLKSSDQTSYYQNNNNNNNNNNITQFNNNNFYNNFTQ